MNHTHPNRYRSMQNWMSNVSSNVWGKNTFVKPPTPYRLEHFAWQMVSSSWMWCGCGCCLCRRQCMLLSYFTQQINENGQIPWIGFRTNGSSCIFKCKCTTLPPTQDHFAMEWCDRNSTVSESDTFFLRRLVATFYRSSFTISLSFNSIDPPTIRLHGAPQIDLEEGKDSLVLRCEADANPPASIVWKRAGRSEIASLQVSTTLIDFSFSDSSFRLRFGRSACSFIDCWCHVPYDLFNAHIGFSMHPKFNFNFNSKTTYLFRALWKIHIHTECIRYSVNMHEQLQSKA